MSYPGRQSIKLFVATRITPFKGFTLTGEMNAESSYFADELNWHKIGGRAVFDLVANYDFSVGPDNRFEFSVFGRIDNLLDRTYYNSVRGKGDSKDRAGNMMVYTMLKTCRLPSIRGVAGRLA